MIKDLTKFNAAKYRDLIELQCDYCGKPIERMKKNCLFNGKPSDRTFCSKKCSHKAKLRDFYENRKCKNCGKDFLAKKFDIKKGYGNFCSQGCNAIYRNLHKTYGTRRSKLEIYLEEELGKLFSNIEFHFNRKDAINSELDIFIPSLKLAFELNGIFHYEPIYGEEKLSQIQNNDSRKFQACIEKGIELCIIDSSREKYFKKARCEKYLKMISNIIIEKLRKASDPTRTP